MSGPTSDEAANPLEAGRERLLSSHAQGAFMPGIETVDRPPVGGHNVGATRPPMPLRSVRP